MLRRSVRPLNPEQLELVLDDLFTGQYAEGIRILLAHVTCFTKEECEVKQEFIEEWFSRASTAELGTAGVLEEVQRMHRAAHWLVNSGPGRLFRRHLYVLIDQFRTDYETQVASERNRARVQVMKRILNDLFGE